MTLLPRHCSAGLMGGALARYIWFLAFWGCFGYTCFSALEDAGFQVLEPLMPAKSFAGGGTDPLLCSTGPGLQNLAGLSVINEKRAFSRDRRSRTPSYRAFKPGSRPLLNSGLPEEAIWRPCSSLEVVYIQDGLRLGRWHVYTTFHFHAARYGVHILTGGCIHQGSAPPPSTRGWGGPASYLLTPIQSASPQTFFGTPDSPGRLAVDRGLHHSWGSILRSCIWPPPPVGISCGE